jgi:release factor glutamine methyltransferase
VNPDPTIFVDVDDGVYSPSDDTFLLLASIEMCRGIKVLEVGTGSGIIALHCAKAGARVTATEISEKAVLNARKNARVNNLNIDFVLTDLAQGIKREFDVVIFNLPYLSPENSGALSPLERQQLVGRLDGLDVPEKFLKMAFSILKKDGRIYLIASSESVVRIIAAALSAYEIKALAVKRLFFETLYTYELRKETGRP